MVRNNINLRVSCIEEGILSYNSQFDNDHGKIVEISHYTRPFFSIVGTVLSFIPLYSLSRFESYSEPLT